MNGVLGLLVISSVVLSSQVWFPKEQVEVTTAKEARVQAPPPAQERRMPDVFRPESIVVKRKDGQVAYLLSGASAYHQIWQQVLAMLPLLRTNPSPPPLIESNDEGPETESVTLWLPAVLRISEWAERWSWSTFGLPGQSARVDRVVIQWGRNPGVQFVGPSGNLVRMSLPPDADQRALQDALKQVDPKLFAKPRSVDVKNLQIRVMPGLAVPDIKEIPVARVKARNPEENSEEARFFPDLSVVRQIDERDARSFTDGQRLLRLLLSGILEYRTADTPGAAPDLSRALIAAQDWVATHGGWPEELLIGHFLQQSGKARIQLEVRSGGGPYPVESAGGAVQVELTADRISYFQRYPDFADTVFEQRSVPVIAPEDALRIVMNRVPLAFMEVQEMHLAYLLHPTPDVKDTNWMLDPTWVVRSGDTRIFVPATAGVQNREPIVLQ